MKHTSIVMLGVVTISSVLAQSLLYDDFSQGNRVINDGLPGWRLLDVGLQQNYPGQSLSFANKMTITVTPPSSAIAITNVVNAATLDPFWTGIAIVAPGHGMVANDCFKTVGITGITGANKVDLARWEPPYTIIDQATNATPIVIRTTANHQITDGWAVKINYVEGNTAANGIHYAKFVDSTHVSLYNDAALTSPVAGNGNLSNPMFGHLQQNQYYVMNNTTWNGSWSGSGTTQAVGCGIDVVRPLAAGSWPSGFFAGWPITNPWLEDTYNRLRLTLVCNKDVPYDPGGNPTISFGTYVKPKNDLNPGGPHYYSDLNTNLYANRTATIEFNRHTSHNRDWGADPVIDDPEYSIGFTIGRDPVHFWDGLDQHYIIIGSIMEWSTSIICSIDDMIMDTVVGGADSYIYNLASMYTGTKYEVHFEGPRMVAPGVTFDVRSSTTSSCRTLGFSNCTNEGTVTSPANSNVTYTRWQSSARSQVSTQYFAFRPRMVVRTASIVNGQPLIITTDGLGHDLATNDNVTVSGLSGAGVSDGTYTITNIPSKKFATSGPATPLTNVVVSSGVATATTPSAHGLKAGQMLWVCGIPFGPPPDDVCFSGSVGHNFAAQITAVTTNTFSWNTSAPNATWTYTYVVSWPALSLNGTSASGSYSSGGIVIASDNNKNFAEVTILADQPITSTSPNKVSGKIAIGGKVLTQ